jgi:hypothetical protein
MTITWILFIWITTQGATSNFIEFKSEASCNAAKAQLEVHYAVNAECLKVQ